MIELSVLNEQSLVPVDGDLVALLEKLMVACVEEEGHTFDGEVSLVFCDDDYIHDLNKTHRGMDKKTDVLSFPQYEPLCDQPTSDPYVYLGDVVISTETARTQAEDYGHDLIREIGFLFVHSMFHLLGYDHDTDDKQAIMRAKEETILKAHQLTR